ncbi:hypothetical protein SSP35_31_00060 [Streptomyces sp. NBRC 110611]|nr:hypothetical protein SSP35_31_00060 [Streptomyces sp. NBRC 110611]
MRTTKIAGQKPFAAGSRIATHSTWCVIGNSWTLASCQQSQDRASDLAAYVNNLCRCHLHTDAATLLPLLLHLAKLMEEYIA